MREYITFSLLRSIFAWLALLFFNLLPAHADTTHTYNFQWYSGAAQTWVFEAAPMLVVDVYEDQSTPENDVFFTFRNNIFTELGSESLIDYIQIDTGTDIPAMFSELSNWDYPPPVDFYLSDPGTPLTLIDLAAERIAWDGDYASNKISENVRESGVGPGEYITLRAVLVDGIVFSDVINALNVGMTTNYANDHYGTWSQEEKDTYRAEATAGLRFSLLVRSTVPNSYHPDGHGLFVTNDLVNVNENPLITSLTAAPSSILDDEVSVLTVLATDPDGGPDILNYQWSVVAGGGVFDNVSSATPLYTPADVIGTKTVRLRVEVSDGAVTVNEELTLQVTDADGLPLGSELLIEDFSSGDLSNWSIWDDGVKTAPSDWQIRSEELVQRNNIWDGDSSAALPKLGTYLLYDNGMGWLDYRVNFVMRASDNDALGIMFRYVDADNYYRFSWDSQRSYRRLVKVENGVFTELAMDNVAYAQGQRYQIEILAQGNQLEVWVDGVRIFQVTDDTHQLGSIAFYSWLLTGAYFDDLVVEDLSGGAFNAFPQITGLTATPANFLDTETSTLAVTAFDPNDGPDALSYQWSVLSGGGLLSDSTSASPIYTPADVVGTQTVTLRVDVSDGAATVSDELTLQVTDADAPPPGPELLFEDFSNTDLSDWSIWDDGDRTGPSDWRIKSDELVQLSNIWSDDGTVSALPKLGTYLLYDNGMVWSDYRVKFVMHAEDNDTLGIMFRYVDADNYYRFSWDSQRSYRRLVKVENGVFTELAADNIAYVQGQRYQIEILAEGEQLEVWVDGVRIFQVTDNTHLQGSIAFYSWFTTGAYFDDLAVEDRSGGVTINISPQIISLSSTPSNILDTETSMLTVVADDPDGGPFALTYLWSIVVGDGVITNASSSTPVYTPMNIVGVQTVILRVEVSDGAATISGELTMQVTDADAPVENTLPQITVLTADSLSILDTETSVLTVVANDPDGGPDVLSYQWSVLSGGGLLDDSTSASPIYTPADVVGTQAVTLRVDVFDGVATVSDELTLQVTDADAPPPGPELLFEDFSNTDISNWSVWDDGGRTGPSDWRIKSGELVQLSNIWDGDSTDALPKLGTYLLNESGMGWLDYRVNFIMRASDNDALGIMFRYIDADNYYRFSWDSQRSYRRLVKVENGVFTELAMDNVAYVQGQRYQIEILAQGNQLEVWIDGVKIFQVNDDTHQFGSIAFYSWFTTGAYFDDLVVEDLSGGAFNAFPRITGLTATPANFLDTETSILAVTAFDPNDGPDALSYQWSVLSGGGMLDDSTSVSPIYTPADVVDTQTVTLRVEVFDGAATVSGELTLQVTDADAPPPGPELLFEDFSNTDLSNWSIWDDGDRTGPSDWRIKSDELVQLSNIWSDDGTISALPKLGTYLLYDNGMVWSDYRVKFVMRSEDNDALGIMFRYIDVDNYYRFSWDSQRSYRRLVKVENGVFTELAADNVAYVQGQSYQMEILAEGEQLEVWVDGVRIFQVTDSNHLQGSIAFYSWFTTGAYFDNLEVEDRSGF